MSPTFDLPGASRGAKWSSCTVHEDGSGQSVTNPCGENQWYLQYSETEGNSSQSKVYKFVRIHLLHLNSKQILRVILSSFFPLFMQEISRQKKQIGRMLGTLMKSITWSLFRLSKGRVGKEILFSLRRNIIMLLYVPVLSLNFSYF